jgi:hypothetical protein
MTQPNNWARDPVKADLGLDNEPVEVVGRVSLSEGMMTVQIELIQGLVLSGIFGVVSSLGELARKSGAKQVVIECTIANEKLLDIAVMPMANRSIRTCRYQKIYKQEHSSMERPAQLVLLNPQLCIVNSKVTVVPLPGCDSMEKLVG